MVSLSASELFVYTIVVITTIYRGGLPLTQRTQAIPVTHVTHFYARRILSSLYHLRSPRRMLALLFLH